MSFRLPYYKQINKMDCGPTCLQMISKFYGRHIPIEELRNIANTEKNGTSVYNLTKAAEEIGFNTLISKVTFNQLQQKITLPCIVYTNENHFVVLYKIKKRITIADPEIGLLKYSTKEFKEKWYISNVDDILSNPSGVVIILEPNSNFIIDQEKSIETSMFNTAKFLVAQLKPYKKQAIQLIITMLIITVGQSLIPFITQSIVDIGISSDDVNFISLLILGNLILILSTSAGNWIRNSITMHISSRIKISLLSKFVVNLSKLPLNFFERIRIGDILQKVKDYQRIESFLMNSAFNVVLAVFTITIFGSILYIYNPTLLIIFIIGSILYISWVLLFWNIRKRMDFEFFELLGKDQSFWIEMFNNIVDIKNYRFESSIKKKWERTQVKLFHVNLKLLNIDQLQQAGTALINSARDLSLILLSALYVIDDKMTLGMFVSIQYIIGQLKGPINQIISSINSFQLAHISLIRINDIEKQKKENYNYSTEEKFFPSERSILLHNVNFKYGANSPLILKQINLSIPRGKITAIVGGSGSGKSTLLKVLIRNYPPLTGNINIGFTNISNVDLKIWRSKIGAITQESGLFNDSIYKNIVLSDNPINKERFYKAVEMANIKKEIERMPNGYKTIIGELGHGLSKGQTQRILIARLLYKNAEYVFLDEAISALDVTNQKIILNNLFHFFKNKTVVLITHRLESVIKADQVIYMKSGKIIEVGPHKKLIDNKNEYYRFFKGVDV